MKQIKRIFTIINWKTLVIATLAVASTYLCDRYGFTAEFPLTLITIAVVFPIVFSIGGAYKRRETALNDYSSIKAHSRSIFLVARDWMDNPDPSSVEKIKHHLREMMGAMRTLFINPVGNMQENEKAVYRKISDISIYIRDDLRKNGLASGEVSRANQYFSKLMQSFENLKHIYQYRTPRTLYAFSQVFIAILPVVYGPYFAHIADEFSTGLMYVTPVLFTAILVSLENIQNQLEHPFDQIGEDDIKFNVEKFLDNLDL